MIAILNFHHLQLPKICRIGNLTRSDMSFVIQPGSLPVPRDPEGLLEKIQKKAFLTRGRAISPIKEF